MPVRGRRRGNPVLWPARHFAALRALQGDRGARGLLRRYAREVVRVPMPDAGVTRDVDTPADLAAVTPLRAHRERGGLDRGADPHVGAAAAHVVLHRLVDVGVGGVRDSPRSARARA